MSDCCEDPDPREHGRDGSWYCWNCDADLPTPKEYTYEFWKKRAEKAEKERDALVNFSRVGPLPGPMTTVDNSGKVWAVIRDREDRDRMGPGSGIKWLYRLGLMESKNV